MKVLHVIIGLRVGGAEMMLLKLLGQMNRSDFEPVVATFLDGGACAEPLQKMGVPVHHLGMNHAWQAPRAMLRLRQLAREFEPDIIQGWMYHGNIAATIVAGQMRARPDLYWNIRHSLADPSQEKFLTRRLIELGGRWSERPRKVVHNSTVSIGQHAEVGFCPDNAVMIPNGFDLDKFSPSAAARRKTRLDLGVPPETFLVGNLGRYHPVKAQGDFIEAAALFGEKNPEIHFLLAGADITAENPVLQKAVLSSGVSERIHLLGPQDDPAAFLAALDIYCLSSHGEGFPNVLGEAMACGVPCVTTDVGEAKEIVIPWGEVAPPADPVSLAAAMESLFGRMSQEGERLGHACRVSIGDRYDLAQIADLYTAMYNGQ
ncbi:MAG: glycosyltransferase involved in cell wall biosynthesis [Candidatus Krumholzibacteriia bacterium]|jgi:glycosyltransferase involved in cell wall biosynthesis